MNFRCFAPLAALAAGALVPPPAAGQATAEGWQPPRLSDGRPDLHRIVPLSVGLAACLLGLPAPGAAQCQPDGDVAFVLATVALQVGDETWVGGIAGSDRIARFAAP